MSTERLYVWSSIAILVVAMFSVQEYSVIPINGTIFLLSQAAIITLFFYNRSRFFSKDLINDFLPIRLYLTWNIIQIARGFTVAENYWDWKGLIANAFALLIPLIAFSTSNDTFMQRLLNFWVRFSLPLAVPLFGLAAALIYKESYGFYLIPISLLVFLLPATPFNWKIIIILTAIFVMAVNLDARSNVIKIGVALMIISYFPLRMYIPREFIKLAHFIILIGPFILFYLGVSGTFNVFKMDEYLEGEATVQVKRVETNEVEAADLKVDTRTFLYEEVLASAKKHDYWWAGRSPARGNESESFGSILTDLTGRGERLGNEAAILNVFTWTGIIGVALYFWVFAKASFLAIYRSNNAYIKLIGLFISFHWMYSWVENFNNFTLPYLLIWMMIGLCMSSNFRDKSEAEVASWVKELYRRNPFSKAPAPEIT